MSTQEERKGLGKRLLSLFRGMEYSYNMKELKKSRAGDDGESKA